MPNFLKRAVFRSSGAFVEGLSRFTKGAAFSVSFARSLLNRVTGYDTCEGLKARVLQCDSEYSAVRGKAQKSKAAYSRAIDERSQCQRDLNALLQRKHMWTPDDVSRFTGLYRDEIRLEQEEHSAKSENSQAEEQLEHAHVSLMNAMRERYQQEQVWSEKIRGISTAGTVGLLLVNLGLFLSVHFVLEPRKRERFLGQISQIVARERQSEEALLLLRKISERLLQS